MSDTIQLKLATLQDLEAVQRIGKQTFMETFGVNNTKEDMDKYVEENFNVSKVKEELSNHHSIFYLAYDGDTTIGYSKLNTGEAQTEMKMANSLEVQRIYVLKEYYGKAVGQLLFNKAIKIAMESRKDFIWLGVWEKNPRAISFYKKNGFVEFGKHIFKLGDDMQTDLMMRLELTKII
jgi:ribosomal protein S18 acetylase RimI-like enzyme